MFEAVAIGAALVAIIQSRYIAVELRIQRTRQDCFWNALAELKEAQARLGRPGSQPQPQEQPQPQQQPQSQARQPQQSELIAFGASLVQWNPRR